MTAVTVCVPVFNAAAFLAETLDSIAAQSFADIKVLISLDRSGDDSESVGAIFMTGVSSSSCSANGSGGSAM